MSKALPKVLIIGDAVAPTGFARVIRNIFEPLQHDFELHQLATRYEGGPHNYPWRLYPAGKGTSVYGYDQIAPLLEEIRPALIFLLYDISFQVRYLAEIRSELQTNPLPSKIVMYSPVEAGPIAPEILSRLSGVSRYVLYTEYAREQIEQTLEQIRITNPSFSFPALDVIPHGVETAKFYPITEPGGRPYPTRERRRAARTALGFDDAEHLDAFIVLNANKNMLRKRIDITVQGFAQFARDKPKNVKLYLHMATEDSGWNVVILANRYHIFDRLIMSQADNTRPKFSDEQLNLLYNACDVGLTTTTGEGWGLVSFEHAATKAAQVVPNHTSLSQLWRGAAQFIEPVMKLTYPGNLTEGHIVTPEGVAEALEKLYRDADLLEELADAGYHNATRTEYSWEGVAAQWRTFLNDTLA
jgi:D-inositol-3-phosphate glycosyltransferase